MHQLRTSPLAAFVSRQLSKHLAAALDERHSRAAPELHLTGCARSVQAARMRGSLKICVFGACQWYKLQVTVQCAGACHARPGQVPSCHCCCRQEARRERH